VCENTENVLCLSQTGSSSERTGMLDRIDSRESSEDISGGQGLERINSVCYIQLTKCSQIIVTAVLHIVVFLSVTHSESVCMDTLPGDCCFAAAWSGVLCWLNCDNVTLLKQFRRHLKTHFLVMGPRLLETFVK